MKNNLKHLLESRVSTSHFDTTRELDTSVILELVQLATTAPSAFNLQNWRFLAVHSKTAKEKLHGLAYGQDQVKDAAVTFVICGVEDGYRELSETLQPSVDRGLLPETVQKIWVDMANANYGSSEQSRRDEAIRSASLAAMTMILAAQGMGLATGAIGGFDPEGVAREFQLAPGEIPVMLLAVGYPAGNGRPQKVRKPVEAVLATH